MINGPCVNKTNMEVMFEELRRHNKFRDQLRTFGIIVYRIKQNKPKASKLSDKVKEIASLEPPKDKDGTKRFLAMLSNYRSGMVKLLKNGNEKNSLFEGLNIFLNNINSDE